MCSIFGNRSARNRGFHSIWAVDTSQARVILCCIIASPGDFVIFASRAAAGLSLEQGCHKNCSRYDSEVTHRGFSLPQFNTLCSGKLALNILLRSKTATARIIRCFNLEHDQMVILTINIVYTNNRILIDATCNGFKITINLTPNLPARLIVMNKS